MLELTLSIITFILMLYVGLFVFLRNTKSWTNRLFFALTLFIDLYVVTNYISLNPPNNLPATQLLWIRIVMAGGAFLGPTVLLLTHTFPKPQIQMKQWKLGVLITLCISTFFASLSPFLFTGIQYPNGSPLPVPGPAIPIYFLDFPVLFLLSFILLIMKSRKAKGIEREQHLYFLVGVIGTFTIMAVSTVVFVVLLRSSAFVFFGPISSLILIGCVGYAIVKQRFLDIRLVTARAVTYTLLTLALGLVYSSTIFIISAFAVGEFSPRSVLISTAVSLIIAFSFQFFKKLFEETTDQILYKGYYEVDMVIRLISEVLVSSVTVKELVDGVSHILREKLHISSVTFVPLHNAEGIKLTDDELHLLHKTGETLVFEEQPEGPVKDLLRTHEISVFMPLRVRANLIGALLLGHKSSGEIYFEKDLRTLSIISSEFAVAIQNAQSFEEIQHFNVTLREEVERATEDLKKANMRLQELDQLKDEFVSVTSHELRTPMTVIQGFVWQALNDKEANLSAKNKHRLERVYNSCRRLIALVNDILDVSRIEAGRMQFTPSVVNVYDLVSDIAEELANKSADVHTQIKVEVPITLFVVADPAKLQQVVINIIDNAIKFTHDGTITVKAERVDANIAITIADTGIGIKPEDMPKLFTKFGKLNNTFLMPSYTGTGLGLYLSKKIIESMHGQVSATSTFGKGTTFHLTLPGVTPVKLDAPLTAHP